MGVMMVVMVVVGIKLELWMRPFDLSAVVSCN